MQRLIRPLHTAAAYRGWAHALLGSATAAAVAMVAAAAVAVAGPGVPEPLVAAIALAAIAALGMFKTTRRAEVRLANVLLGTGLPRPAVARRLATAAWALVWAAAGTVLMACSVLTLIAMGMVLVWLNGGELVTIGGDVTIPGGRAGAVTVPIAVGSLLALVYASAAYAALMRRLALRLLGPGLSERLAAAEAEADRVAARNRLARDLHDSIGHTLTTSTIQAAVAKQVLDSDPEAARRAIESIEDSSRAALDDLDRALGVLRDEPAPARATPTLKELGPLRDRVARAGTELAVAVEGDLALVTPAVSQEAYRIVQEGVTNALKHAPGSEVSLSIEVDTDQLRLRVANGIAAESGKAETDGGSSAASGTGGVRNREEVQREQGTDDATDSRGAGSGRSPAYGRGLTGITERVRLLGGKASAGPDGAAQWTLRADLPLRAERAGDRLARQPIE
jgi:signal transduction histidine kinase